MPQAYAPRSIQKTRSIWPAHLEHGVGPNYKVVAAAPCPHDRLCQRSLVDAVLDESLVDVDRDHLAQGEPALHFRAVGGLQLNDLRQLAFEGDRAFGDARHVDFPAGHRGEAGDPELIDIVAD